MSPPTISKAVRFLCKLSDTFLSDFNLIWCHSTDFRRKSPLSN